MSNSPMQPFDDAANGGDDGMTLGHVDRFMRVLVNTAVDNARSDTRLAEVAYHALIEVTRAYPFVAQEVLKSLDTTDDKSITDKMELMRYSGHQLFGQTIPIFTLTGELDPEYYRVYVMLNAVHADDPRAPSWDFRY